MTTTVYRMLATNMPLEVNDCPAKRFPARRVAKHIYLKRG
jgi:hypothetical protein